MHKKLAVAPLSVISINLNVAAIKSDYFKKKLKYHFIICVITKLSELYRTWFLFSYHINDMISFKKKSNFLFIAALNRILIQIKFIRNIFFDKNLKITYSKSRNETQKQFVNHKH